MCRRRGPSPARSLSRLLSTAAAQSRDGHGRGVQGWKCVRGHLRSRPEVPAGCRLGIGKAAAHAPAEAGCDVVGTSRKPSGSTSRGGVTFLGLDVTSDDSFNGVVQEVIERFGRIDVLVNKAGIGANASAEETSVVQAQT
ncbi:SDR family oxidoreductase, partial [Streptomyces sp. NPDC002920]